MQKKGIISPKRKIPLILFDLFGIFSIAQKIFKSKELSNIYARRDSFVLIFAFRKTIFSFKIKNLLKNQ